MEEIMREIVQIRTAQGTRIPFEVSDLMDYEQVKPCIRQSSTTPATVPAVNAIKCVMILHIKIPPFGQKKTPTVQVSVVPSFYFVEMVMEKQKDDPSLELIAVIPYQKRLDSLRAKGRTYEMLEACHDVVVIREEYQPSVYSHLFNFTHQRGLYIVDLILR